MHSISMKLSYTLGSLSAPAASISHWKSARLIRLDLINVLALHVVFLELYEGGNNTIFLK